uniref:Uncharacterized protein n=1 Tax=Phytophthora fragariae TaxID=53985 RepID=A0A6A3DE14_9STRA|nr:hypothetical protein PF009_g32699 [Phytophthora fragariae]
MQTNNHIIHVADSGARCFWSDTTSPIYNERHGVDLVLSSAPPFGDVEDITTRVYKDQLRNRYLLLKTTLGRLKVYLRVVDFNVTMYNYLDQTSPSPHLPGMGREDLYEWLDALGLMDAWRFVNPTSVTTPVPRGKIGWTTVSFRWICFNII